MANSENSVAPRTRSSDARDARKDGRRQFLVYLEPALIERVKMAAITANMHTYEIVEELLNKNIHLLEKEAYLKQSARRKEERAHKNKTSSE